MKFTIGTVSNFQDYDEDIKLIKSSILYADEIELIGMTEYAVFCYIPKIFDNNKKINDLIDSMIPFIKSINLPNKDELLDQLETVKIQLQQLSPILNKRSYRSKSDFQIQMKMKQLEKDLKERINATLLELKDHPTAQELQMLIEKNIISVFNYDLFEMNTNEMAGSYIGNMLNAIYAQNTYPLFDNTSTKFIGEMSKINLIDISNLNPEVLRHAGVATNILMTLPTLEGATYDELLDIKKQNAVPLLKFRKSIYEFSEKISSLPWDDDFQYDCLKIYNTEVVPRVAEINELFTETSVLKNLGKKVLADETIRKTSGFIFGGLATAITTSHSLLGWIKNLLLAMSLATLSAEVAKGFWKVCNTYIQARDETKAATKKGKDNVMYYYYLASKL